MTTHIKNWRVCMSADGLPLTAAHAQSLHHLSEERVSYHDINWDHRNGTPPDTHSIWFVNAVDELDAYIRAVEKEKAYRRRA